MLLRNYLQTQQGLPRRQIIALINEGAIFLNGQKVENYKSLINSGDQILIPPLKLELITNFSNSEEKPKSQLLLFNKPKWYTCSKSDPHNPTFYELLPNDFRNKYYYIGRLDKESRGLILLTSDPKLVHAFEHPSKEILKTYRIKLNRPFDRSLKTQVLKGIREWWEFLRTKKIEKTDAQHLLITLNEGKKRHIRRIFKVLGYQVIDLQRLSIADYQLGTLAEWTYQSITI